MLPFIVHCIFRHSGHDDSDDNAYEAEELLHIVHCIFRHSGRDDSDDYGYEAEDPSDLGYATPVSIETPIQSSVSR